jgi:hypothetical protein
VAPEQIPALRLAPGPGIGESLPASFLKHADDQTVVGIGAIFRAIDQNPSLSSVTFADWGVLAAPRFLGRATLASALQRFALEGAWGVSPHLIPHQSLHSVSGTVSQALGVHGPNFGVGGGPGCASEGILAAGALLSEERVPSVWLILTGWDPEPVLERPGQSATNGHRPAPSICSAAALALTTLDPDWSGAKLILGPGVACKPNGRPRLPAAVLPWFRAEALIDFLENRLVRRGAWNLGCGAWLEVERAGTEAEINQ